MSSVKDEKYKSWLRGELKKKNIHITFIKDDGTKRNMEATLNPQIIAESGGLPLKQGWDKAFPEGETTPNYQNVFDLEKRDWRCFKWDRLMGIDLT